ncbi:MULTISPECIES: phage head closure protein [Rhizobium/Agrobacterium group]|uniref:Bacteriophage head-tail adaptor n=1 Tax=Allorhizobium ampelinum (strain ATCC BAA-846 / DSM 112012 / S4) TaxID=311402 RepID=B9K2S6_ALLAM|nr:MULTISPECIES: phage head closure protein [Rhizobium/Agrobacterium group]ACM39174.1 Bacteriophage head-tail adaptor [Allorhizobium ampelinum S4]MUO27194.1 phage head closure protein [Agrobacterium vitis]
MRAGKLDRRITLLRETETGRDALNQPILEWVGIKTVWAGKTVNKGTEVVQAQQMSGTRPLTFRIRHRPGLSLKDRVRYDGALYEIKDIREIGRRVGLDLDCVAVAE